MRSIETLEKELKEIQTKIDSKKKQLENLDRIYEEKNHQLYFLNNQIDGLDKQLKDTKVASAAQQKALFEQQQLVQQKSEEQTSIKLRKTFQNFFQSQRQKQQATKANTKMEVNSIAVYFLENPHDTVQQEWMNEDVTEEKEAFQIQFRCATFMLRKTTTIGQVFDLATLYWGVARNQFSMYDLNCNCMELLFDYTAESFFSAHKETNPFAVLYIWRKNVFTHFLLDEQKKNITIAGKEANNQNLADENMKLITQDLDNFVEVQPGLVLYKGQDQEKEQQPSGSISIGWKILLLLLSGTYLALLYVNGQKAFDYKVTSYLRQSLINYMTDYNLEVNSFSDLYNKSQYLTITDRTYSDSDPTQYEDTIRFQFIQMREYIKVFQVLTNFYDCNFLEVQANYTNCTYAIYSNTDALQENFNDYNDELQQWGHFYSSEQSGISSFSGRLSSYDGGGYDESYDAYSYANELIDQDQEQGMFNQAQTKLVSYDMVFYDDSRQVFYVAYYFFEVAPSYEFIQQVLMVAYRINKFDAKDQRLIEFNNLEYTQLAFSAVLSLTLMYISYKETYNKIKISKGAISIKRDFFEFMQLGFLYNFCILLLQIISFIFFFQGPNSVDEIFNDGSVKNLMVYAQSFKTALIMRGALIIMVGFNTLKLYQISESVAFMQAMAAKGAENIMMIIILAFTILAAFSFLFFALFHQKLFEFSSYYNSFISVCSMFFMGNYKIWDKGVELEPTMMIVLTLLIFIVFSQGAVVLINAVLQEVYRTISYRKDHLQTIYEFYAKIKEIQDKITHYLSKIYSTIKKKK